jgi:hypothetical protein
MIEEQLTPLRFGHELFMLSSVRDPVLFEFDDGRQITVQPDTATRLFDVEGDVLHLKMTLRGETEDITLRWPERSVPKVPDNVVEFTRDGAS